MTTLQTALLSYGMSGRVFHAPFIHQHPGLALRGAWERSQHAIQADYPTALSYPDLDSLLADAAVELVIVNTPNYTHYEYAKKALEAGKHVVVEKAFTATAAEAYELAELAKQKNLKLAVYQNRRWDSDFLTVQQVVNDGLLGELVEANIAFSRYKPELSPKQHKELPGPGAGVVKDLGPHVIDQALCLFGVPEGVFADIGITRPGSQVDDYFDILMTYDLLRVHVRGGFFFREPVAEYAFHGTLGSFLKKRGDVQEDQLQSGLAPNAPGYGVEPAELEGLLHTTKNGSLVRERGPTLPGNYRAFYEGVYQSIVANQPEPVTALEGAHVMRIIDAAFESQRTGGIVWLD